ncbi:MAG TPA: hypothetical protein VIC63_05540 [Candidatus Limnocylindria bacterium]|jgi:uncharacterized cupredoxin-like copper-binding protein
MNGPSRRHSAAIVLPVLLILAGCSSSASSSPSDEPEASGGGVGTTVDVELQEFAVIPAEASAPAGPVTFSVTNNGPDVVHQFVIIRTDLEPGDLPTDEHGVVDESGEGIEVVDEIEDIPVGETMEVTADLEAGSYVLICNVFDEASGTAHYSEGMRAAFTVE